MGNIILKVHAREWNPKQYGKLEIGSIHMSYYINGECEQAVRLKLYAEWIVLTKIFKTTTSIFLSLILLSWILFAKSTKTDAMEYSSPLLSNGDDAQRIAMEPYSDNEELEGQSKRVKEGQSNINDLLGEEQVFPFKP